MPRINFYLKDYKLRSGEQSIFAQMTYRGVVVRVHSQLAVPAKYWDSKKQCVKTSHPQGKLLNEALRMIETMLGEVFIDFVTKGILVPAREEFLAEFERRTQPKDDLNKIFEQFVKDRRPHVSLRAAQIYQNAWKHYVAYCKRASTPLSFSAVTEDSYNGFVAYLAELGQLNNTIGMQTKQLKTFFAWCERHGHHVPGAKFWKKPKENVEIITLTDEEVTRIEALKLSGTRERVRLQFLVECYSGLRWSDVVKVDAQNLNADEIVITTRRTRDLVHVPVTAPLRAALKALQGDESRTMSPQKLTMR